MGNTYLLKSILSFAFIVSLLSSCSPRKESVVDVSSEFIQYISAYSGGVLSKNSAIQIELAHPHPDAEKNKVIEHTLFKFKPQLKGVTTWLDEQTIQFTPTQELKSGTYYKVEFNLAKLLDLPQQFNRFDFGFYTREIDLSLTITDFITYSESPDFVSVQANLISSDQFKLEEIKPLLSVVDHKGAKLDYTLSMQSGEQYLITIPQIAKKTVDWINIKVEAQKLGAPNPVELSVTIPDEGVFELMDCRRIAVPEQGIRLIFSEPLSTKQAVSSFVRLEGGHTYSMDQVENTLFIYFEEGIEETLALKLHRNLKSATGNVIAEDKLIELPPLEVKPQLALLTKGTILPNSHEQNLHFRARGLESVDIHVVKVLGSNLPHFLQINELSGSNQLKRSGRLILKKRINLEKLSAVSPLKWRDYAIDLATLFSQEPGALYHIGLSFTRNSTIYKEERAEQEITNSMVAMQEPLSESEEWDDANRYYGGLELAEPYNWEVYQWKERENPNHPTFYMVSDNVSVTTNLYSTHLGLIVKQNSSGQLWVAVNNILNTKPIEGVKVKVYSFQLQQIGEGVTNGEGLVKLNSLGVPFLVVAELGGEKSYLRVPQGSQLTTSRFEVGGTKREQGLKGFVYGERGVWRPGDTLHVSFILEDREHKIPENHPVSFELYNPSGQFYTKLLATEQEGGHYYFAVPTQASDPTGLWNGYVKIGGSSFHKSFRIETIKPNRLKIDLDFDKTILSSKNSNKALLRSHWLTGSAANSLKTKIELTLRNFRSPFPAYDKYLFTNVNSSFVSSKQELFSGNLNSAGELSLDLDIPVASTAPGMLKGQFVTRVYEPGGDVSIHSQELAISPFKTYVGLALPEAANNSTYLETDKSHVFEVISLTEAGRANVGAKIEYEIYKVGWSWWFDQGNALTNYIQNSSVHPVQKGVLTANSAGKAQVEFGIKYPEYGPYLIYLKDKESEHTVSQSFFIDWPSWIGRADRPNPTGLTMLSFSLDKEEYVVGEEVSVILPAAAKGRALVSIEDGGEVIKQEWVKTQETEDTIYRFTAKASMSPNVYVFVTLLQPHDQTVNDSPIRMYGVQPVVVKDKNSKLNPLIKIPAVLEPEKAFSVEVKEEQGRAMTYTLAIVDEGLLDLTTFKTPNPWEYFYSKEALGVSTWDLYDEVVGAMVGTYKKLFSIGGDEMLSPADAKVNRFNPVVKFMGPFTLSAGKTAKHNIELPMYVGSVRTMVVASNGEGFGSSEETSLVRAPLMLLSSLPAKLSISEELSLPINLFVMEESLKEVKIEVTTSSNILLSEGKTKVIPIREVGDQLIYFNLKIGDKIGIEKINIKATSGGHTVSEEIEVAVRNPNPLATKVEELILAPGKTGELNYSFTEGDSDKQLVLEFARIPSINLSSRLQFLANYPHQSTEQIVSRAFPLLFLDDLSTVESELNAKSKEVIHETIQKLYGRQLADGSFSYWPQSNANSPWITAYAALFLTRAKEQGYAVNSEVLNRWKRYQSRIVRQWTANDASWAYSYYNQAYALYVLAVAGSPDLAAMNRLREEKESSNLSRWALAAAYAWIGKESVANELVFNLSTQVEEYNPINRVFGSSLRDEAFILQTLLLLKQQQKAFNQASYLVKRLKEETHYQTQSTAFALMAMADYARHTKSSEMNLKFSVNSEKEQKVLSQKMVVQQRLSSKESSGQVKIENLSSGQLYGQLIQSAYVLKDELPAANHGLDLTVRYRNLNGDPISVNNLKQGSDFIAWVEVVNTSRESYEDIALTHLIPTGWEIYNTRFVDSLSDEADSLSSAPRVKYQDIKDDSILSYFDLQPNERIRLPIRLQALYAGRFIIPAIRAELMYKPSVFGRTAAAETTISR